MPVVGYFLEARRKPKPGIFFILSLVYLVEWVHPNFKINDLSQGAILIKKLRYKIISTGWNRQNNKRYHPW